MYISGYLREMKYFAELRLVQVEIFKALASLCTPNKWKSQKYFLKH